MTEARPAFVGERAGGQGGQLAAPVRLVKVDVWDVVSVHLIRHLLDGPAASDPAEGQTEVRIGLEVGAGSEGSMRGLDDLLGEAEVRADNQIPVANLGALHVCILSAIPICASATAGNRTRRGRCPCV